MTDWFAMRCVERNRRALYGGLYDLITSNMALGFTVCVFFLLVWSFLKVSM